MTNVIRKSPLVLPLAALLLVPLACGGGGGGNNNGGHGGGDEGGKGGSSSGGKGGSSSGGKGGSSSGGMGGSDTGGAGGSDTGGAGGSATGGAGGGASGGNYTFGSHSTSYTAGSIKPKGDQKALDDAVKAFYGKWKTAYLKNDCTGGYYVFSNGGAGAGADTYLTVSEAHGYGMLISALMNGADPDAQKIFDGFVALMKKYPSVNNKALMAWGIDQGCRIVKGNDSATDGDLDMAHALLLAEKIWGNGGANNYGDLAKTKIAAILKSEMNPTSKLPLLGDWDTADDPLYYYTRSSDFMVDHYRAFAKATGDMGWTASLDAVYKLVDYFQTKHSPMTGLISDFISATNTDMPLPVPVSVAMDPMGLGEDLTTDFDYNACRVPWRLGTDYLVNGEAKAKTALGKINTFIKMKTGGDPSKVIDGYSLAGEPHTANMPGPNDCFIGSFGVSGMVDSSNQAWVDAVWKYMNDEAELSDYYGDTIKLLTMIVMSGNWWAP